MRIGINGSVKDDASQIHTVKCPLASPLDHGTKIATRNIAFVLIRRFEHIGAHIDAAFHIYACHAVLNRQAADRCTILCAITRGKLSICHLAVWAIAATTIHAVTGRINMEDV